MNSQEISSHATFHRNYAGTAPVPEGRFAALQGKTIKAYVLERALADMLNPGDTDLKALKALLKSRIEAAEKGAVSDKSVADIVDETLRETDRR